MTPTFARQPLPEERKTLEEWIKNPPSRDHYIRARIILLSADGLSAPDIARRIGRHESRVRMWIRQFNRFGIEGLYSGKPLSNRAKPIEEGGQRESSHQSSGPSPRKSPALNEWVFYPVPERAEGE
ncbi:MAG: helix-turn-helix domain-containing protein [Blastocatellia bacterium]|nr:helix-turn-helix domain-containing protein [Blastocatellia bacterium]MCX7751601.1 helix-turn-helix domain-containing protein [Blastocatellia bacterium]MDW8168701.1 helix-turn-helix domain-containing protein [Acidobacteriota bacterium]MDW8256967.1 helix-turn-helix domain-containing protein [Acidobacteriota bacterium]